MFDVQDRNRAFFQRPHRIPPRVGYSASLQKKKNHDYRATYFFFSLFSASYLISQHAVGLPGKDA